jgi:hypothetical protein
LLPVDGTFLLLISLKLFSASQRIFVKLFDQLSSFFSDFTDATDTSCGLLFAVNQLDFIL